MFSISLQMSDVVLIFHHHHPSICPNCLRYLACSLRCFDDVSQQARHLHVINVHIHTQDNPLIYSLLTLEYISEYSIVLLLFLLLVVMETLSTYRAYPGNSSSSSSGTSSSGIIIEQVSRVEIEGERGGQRTG